MKMNLFPVSLMRVVKVIYMFNLTNVGLNMCVKRIFRFISEFDDSDLFLNLMIEYEPILAFIFVRGNYLVWRKKFV
jgi:hypothetical protein